MWHPELHAPKNKKGRKSCTIGGGNGERGQEVVVVNTGYLLVSAVQPLV